MKFFPNITNKSRYKRCCYKILGDIQAIITNFLPHASPLFFNYRVDVAEVSAFLVII